jgi:hypothetical protein
LLRSAEAQRAQSNQSAFHHITALAHLQRELGVLLHQQHRHAFGGDFPDGFEDPLHHERRQPHAGLVQEQQFWRAHQRAADGEHLLLAPGQGPSGLPAPLVQPRKQLEHAQQVGPYARGIVPGIRTHLQVLLYR